MQTSNGKLNFWVTYSGRTGFHLSLLSLWVSHLECEEIHKIHMHTQTTHKTKILKPLFWNGKLISFIVKNVVKFKKKILRGNIDELCHCVLLWHLWCWVFCFPLQFSSASHLFVLSCTQSLLKHKSNCCLAWHYTFLLATMLTMAKLI